MFIAHLPVAYLASRALAKRGAGSSAEGRRLIGLGMAAGLAPDLDLLWFFLVDQRRQVHHNYLPHLPAFAIACIAAAALALAMARARRETWLALAAAGLNWMLHLVLDTVAGGVQWLWPLSRHELVLSHVEARYQPWYLNFLLHWTFALELALVTVALWTWKRRRTPPVS